MILISQNRNVIMNFDNITSIFVAYFNEKYCIRCEVDNKLRDIAEYEEEKTAMKILNEIIIVYQFCYKNDTHTVGEQNALKGYYDRGVYKLPMEFQI